jgi:hypothetical protein
MGYLWFFGGVIFLGECSAASSFGHFKWFGRVFPCFSSNLVNSLTSDFVMVGTISTIPSLCIQGTSS